MPKISFCILRDQTKEKLVTHVMGLLAKVERSPFECQGRCWPFPHIHIETITKRATDQNEDKWTNTP